MSIDDADPQILDAANKWNVDPQALKSIMYVESRGNPNAVGPAIKGTGEHAQGPFQFTSATAKQYGLKNPFDTGQAADAAAHYLSDLLDQHGDLDTALAYYSGGAAGYGEKFAAAYKTMKPPVAADPDISTLPPEEQALMREARQPGTGAQPPAPQAAPTPSEPDLSALPPEEQTFLKQARQPPPLPPAPPPAAAPPPDQPWYYRDPSTFLPQSWQPAAKAFEGGANTAQQAIGRNIHVPLPGPTSDESAAMKEHPYWATGGNVATGMAAAVPVTLASEAAIGAIAPEAAAAAYTRFVPKVLQYGARGALSGAESNLLTGDPNESALSRAGWGAASGAPFGVAAGELGNAFGAGRSIGAGSANAARIAQDTGVTDIGLPNLPGGEAGLALGATPSEGQLGQITRATSRFFGDEKPDFKAANLQSTIDDLQAQRLAAARQGEVDMSANGPVYQTLADIEHEATGVPHATNSVRSLINNILAKTENGKINGEDFDTLVRRGSRLYDHSNVADPDISRFAKQIDQALDTGFSASNQDAYNSWADARTKLRALYGVEKSIDPSTGQINPGSLFENLQQKFPGLKSELPDPDNFVGRLGSFAGAVRKLYGGGGRQSQPEGFWNKVPGYIASEGLPALMAYLHGGIDPLTAATGVTAPLALAGLKGLGKAWQQSPTYINSLIARGGAAIPNNLIPLASAFGGRQLPSLLLQSSTPPAARPGR